MVEKINQLYFSYFLTANQDSMISCIAKTFKTYLCLAVKLSLPCTKNFIGKFLQETRCFITAH